MNRRRFLAIAAGMMVTTAATAGVGPVPGSYPIPSPPEYWSPSGGPPNAISGVSGPYGYPVIPDLLGRAVEFLATINSVQERETLAEDWLSFTRKIIVQDMQYRQQWVKLQRQQLAQASQVQQLQLQVAKLQEEIEQLRAHNTPPEQGPASQPEKAPAGSPTKSPGAPAPL
jgi:hypothetical protein